MPDNRNETAQQIYQDVLDRIGDAVSQVNLDLYLACFVLPHRFETYDGSIELRSSDDLALTFRATLDYFQTNGIRLMDRNCTLAEHVDARTITGCHETRLIDGKNRIHDAYAALTTMVLTDDGWRATHGQFAEPGAGLPSAIVRKHGQIRRDAGGT